MNSASIRTVASALVTLLSFAPLFGQNPPDPLVPPPPSMAQPNLPQHGAQTGLASQDSGSSHDPMQAMRDRSFLRKAAEGGLAEVKFAQLAAQKSPNDEIKALGQKMVDDHTRINTDIAELADTTGVMLPKDMNKDAKAEYDRLSSLSGDDFDREYLTCMVKTHHTDLHDFRVEANSTTDDDLKMAVQSAAATIHSHMVAVDRLARERGIEVPGRQKQPATVSQK